MMSFPLRPRIFEAVEALRQRKCRPDRESIAHYVLRKYGVKFNEVFNELESVVDEELLIKVEYKGSISYRLPSQFGNEDTRSSPLLTKHSKILNSVQTTRQIIRALNELLSAKAEYNVEGVPVEELTTHLQLIHPDKFGDVKGGIAIERELFSKSGNLFRSPKGRIFPKDIPIPPSDPHHHRGEGQGHKSQKKEGKKQLRRTKAAISAADAGLELEESGEIPPTSTKVAETEAKTEIVQIKKVKRKNKVEPTKDEAKVKATVVTPVPVPIIVKGPEIKVKKIKRKSKIETEPEPEPNEKSKKPKTSTTNKRKLDKISVHVHEVNKIEIEEDTKKSNPKRRKSRNLDSRDKTESAKKATTGIEPESGLSKNPSTWTSSEVEIYFQLKGLKEEGAILKEQEIDGLSLLLMRRKDVVGGIPKLLVGPALKVHRIIRELQVNNDK